MQFVAGGDCGVGTVTDRLRTGEQLAIVRLTLGEECRATTARYCGDELGGRSTDPTPLGSNQQ
jgi:hypothetical protein